MRGADDAIVAQRPKRGPGRPPKYPRPQDGQEPPSKRRRYNARTPDPSRTRSDKNNEMKTPYLADNIPSDGDLLHSALKSEGPEDDTNETPMQENPVSPKTMRARTESRSRRTYARTRSRGRPTATPRPRYSSAAAAAAASQASDGYKPREERSWEEFHPDLDIEAELMVYTADEVDGRAKPEYKLSGLRQDTTNTEGPSQDGAGLGIVGVNGDQPVAQEIQEAVDPTPVKRRPGRPPRRPESMLTGLGSPPAPRILPLPTHNPKERLNLPKPSYRHVQTFKMYEEDKKVQSEDYVDKAMANVGYQESERFEIPPDVLIRHVEAAYDDELGAGLTLESDTKDKNRPAPQVGDVEYDMDEQDERWLEAHNAHRMSEEAAPIKPSIFEITMTQIEREYYALEKRIPKPNPRHANPTRPRSSSAAAVNGEPWGAGDEPDSKCAICDDGDCENANAIIFCDGCDLAVHQECYGVPFIPEGQWFCRKCKEIGRGTPTCIFCPNIDGAFKQTNTLRWSHLLCAIWIPEVTIANPTYMEPIQDVDKVPRNRWGLVCYICDQRMGACIQCSNKVCYQAFHVTCARRARLFLKMKATPTSGIDTSILKAFCDKHVSPEWRRDHDTDTAIREAKRYYRKTMRDRKWADSQTAALALATNEQVIVEPTIETDPPDDKSTIVLGGNKRKKKEPVKTGWRLPSGAPVVPSVVFTAVEQSLARFMLRKRKDFVAEACKYWTLKREARRGAALLKRLQLQLETSSTMEVTRRNFVGMGAAGRPRLVRRIEFAELLQKDLVNLTSLVESVTEREQKKLDDAEHLKRLMDSIYFPLSDLLWPILRKAQKIGEKSHIFEESLSVLERKLSERSYTSVAAFSADIGGLFASIISKSNSDAAEESQTQDISQIHAQIVPLTWSERKSERDALSAEQKQQKQVAKRIVRTIKEPLEAALRKEAELKGVPFEKEFSEWNKLDARLESCISHEPASEQGSVKNAPAVNGDTSGTRARNDSDISISVAGGASPAGTHGTADAGHDAQSRKASTTTSKNGPIQAPSPPISSDSNPASISVSAAPVSQPLTSTTTQPATRDSDPFTSGGIPWYMRAYSPVGTTVHAERWHRAVSEDLSEVDEATLNDLQGNLPAPASAKKSSPKKKKTTAAATNGGGGGTSRRERDRARRSQANQTQTPATEAQRTRTTRAGSVATSVAGSATGSSTARASRSRAATTTNGTPAAAAANRKASVQVAAGAGAVDGDGDVEMADGTPDGAKAADGGRARARRSAAVKAEVERGDGAAGDGVGGGVDGETEEERAAREKRERYNAKRRAQRRNGF